jgi:hypothetical protein
VTAPTNPFNHVCGRCGGTLQTHQLIGRKAKCDDDNWSDFQIWQVVDAKRALGHKINMSLAHAAMRSKAEHEYANDPDRR